MRIGPGRSTRALPLLALLAGSVAAQEGAGPGWQGRYRYEHAAGRTAGGTGIVVTYDLTLGPAGARGGCLLSIQGFQTDERIVCQTRAQGGDLAVAFHRYPDGRTVNRYGVAIYKPGETLFTLAQGEGKGEGKTLDTRWGTLRPDGDGVAGRGIYFQKMR